MRRKCSPGAGRVRRSWLDLGSFLSLFSGEFVPKGYDFFLQGGGPLPEGKVDQHGSVGVDDDRVFLDFVVRLEDVESGIKAGRRPRAAGAGGQAKGEGRNQDQDRRLRT